MKTSTWNWCWNAAQINSTTPSSVLPCIYCPLIRIGHPMNPTGLHSIFVTSLGKEKEDSAHPQVITRNSGIARASGWLFVVVIVVSFSVIIVGFYCRLKRCLKSQSLSFLLCSEGNSYVQPTSGEISSSIILRYVATEVAWLQRTLLTLNFLWSICPIHMLN